MRRYYKYGLENLRSVSSLSSLSVSVSKNERVRTRFSLAAGIALLIHASFLGLIPVIELLSPKAERFHYTKIKLKDAEKMPEKMFVTIAPDAEQTRPKQAKLLAAYDQSTNREMKSTITSLNPENLSAAPQIKSARAQAVAAQKVIESDRGIEPPAIDDFFEKDPQDPLGLKNGLDGLAAVNVMPFSDHLPDTEEGDHTELNTWQWRHAPFFNRIKARVAKVWAPNLQIARYDPQGALLGQKDRVTVMSVTINQQGLITALSIANSSEVAYLDEEADRTFRAAAPFPYPPKELFKNSNEFSFNFAFHLQINRGWSFDFDWEKP